MYFREQELIFFPFTQKESTLEDFCVWQWIGGWGAVQGWLSRLTKLLVGIHTKLSSHPCDSSGFALSKKLL